MCVWPVCVSCLSTTCYACACACVRVCFETIYIRFNIESLERKSKALALE